MVGFGANRRGGRLPSFLLVALLVIILVLSFNYWSVSRKHGRLLDELLEAQAQVKRTDAARSRLEKRNAELVAQADAQRRQVEQREADVNTLETKLQGRDAQVKKCVDEKVKLQNEGSSQSSEMQKLREQLRELQQEFQKQEEQLREVRKNSTQLERKLEYESFQCGRQIGQLKEEYEEKTKVLEKELARFRQGVLESPGTGTAGKPEREEEGAAVQEHHTEATHQHQSPEIKDLGKLGSDAGMPGIEDSEVGKVENLEYAVKKPAITQNQLPAGNGGGGAVVGLDTGAVAAHVLPLEPHDLKGDNRQELEPQRSPEHQVLVETPNRVLQQPLQAVGDRPVLFDEDNKVDVHADELGEHHGQLKAPEGVNAEAVEHRVGLPPPPNPAQVLPNPMEPQREREPQPAQAPRHRQSRFFDENESPVDPQQGSKLADYNGDDGNVGEYEADKQAELAYNEEEDGDGGEEDVQDDEDRELQGDRGVEYGKRHQAGDIL